jgi:hypothetical protein
VTTKNPEVQAVCSSEAMVLVDKGAFVPPKSHTPK